MVVTKYGVGRNTWGCGKKHVEKLVLGWKAWEETRGKVLRIHRGLWISNQAAGVGRNTWKSPDGRGLAVDDNQSQFEGRAAMALLW